MAETLRDLRGSTRSQKLQALSALEGFYVPVLYPMEQLPDGRILPPVDAPPIRKRVTPTLRGDAFPVDYIVPYTGQVHDRVSLEVLRGCTQGCRFCQAGMTTRPVRERKVTEVGELLERSLDATGYEEVSLVSLSTCDHSRVEELVNDTAERASRRRVSVSLPSLRLDSFSVGLADKVAGERRTGLTFAPEAASPRLRALINKWIPDEDLLGMATKAYESGWRHVKLYFMIGLPTERDDDVEAIADLCLRTLEKGREVRRDAHVNLGVSTFVPKPFTPFQWAPQLDRPETHRRQGLLREAFRGTRGVKFGRHNPAETWLEGLVTRADRRAADLIEAAFRQGARLDAWGEHLDVAAWERAIEETGFDVADALRERDLDERLPWDHIDVMIPKSWFREDWERAVQLMHAPDCRHSQCHRCGVIDVERELCAHMLRNAIAGAKEEGTWTPKKRSSETDPMARAATTAPLGARLESKGGPIRPEEPPPVQKLRFRVARQGELRFLSHLETMRAWIRSLRRARAPLAYSQGFHPHPRVAFSCALPTGEVSVGDYMDVVLVEREDPAAFLVRLAGVLPEGLGVLSVEEVPLKAPSLMSVVAGFDYAITTDEFEVDEMQGRVEVLLASPQLTVQRRAKRRGRKTEVEVDIRGAIDSLTVASDEGRAQVQFRSRDRGSGLAKAREIVALLGLDPHLTAIEKQDTYLRDKIDAPEGVVA
jgi:radical SAM-linked protein